VCRHECAKRERNVERKLMDNCVSFNLCAVPKQKVRRNEREPSQAATHSSENNKWDWFLLISDAGSDAGRGEKPISRLLLAKAK